MELKQFDGQNRDELSMIEVAHAILSQHGDVMGFADLTNEIQTYLGKNDLEVRDRLSQFYTDLNADGSFISLGENLWGLRSWYPFDSIDEAVAHVEDEDDEDRPKRKKRKKVNAFLADVADDDDVIDYNDDDPEDDDLDATYEDDTDDTDGDSEIKGYDKDLDEIADDSDSDDEEELPEGIEDQLSEISDDDTDDDEENN
ncbi:DNA-directed RNA polymerase subunit delta [Dellaglioa sp. BT-FLS60]